MKTKNEIEQLLVFADADDLFLFEKWKDTKAKRTLAQNNVFWRCFTLIGDKMGYTKEEVRDNCMKALFGVRETKFGGVIYENSIKPHTSDLNKEEAIQLIETVLEFGKKLGLDNMITPRERIELFNNT